MVIEKYNIAKTLKKNLNIIIQYCSYTIYALVGRCVTIADRLRYRPDTGCLCFSPSHLDHDVLVVWAVFCVWPRRR